jgi:hypothetical protein
MTEHAVFAPSASDRWLNCPASHLRSLALPPAPSSSYAERGTQLHDLGAIGILKGLKAMDVAAADSELEADERAALATYVKFCMGLRRGAVMWRVEQRVAHSSELFGTIDFFAIKGTTLHVVDFKGGRGIFVDALDNPQLLTYAMMLCEAAETGDAALPRIDTVQVHIVQPLYASDAPIRSASYSRAQIAAWYNRVTMAMARAKNVDAPYNPGEHCRFCPVKPQCPALLGLVQQMPSPPVMEGLPVAKLAEWLAKADVIETWIAALREHAHGLINIGTAIPGWKLVDKRATRKWSNEAGVLTVAKANNIRAQELELLSPAKLEKKYKTIPLVLRPFVDQTPSGKNLVRDPATAVAPGADQQPALDTALLNLQYRV